MNDSDILHRRQRNQQIAGKGFSRPVDAVQAFGAMQAQEFAMACWAVGLRTPGTVEADVLAAFDAGEIIRTHVLRPTWHFVAASDLRWILALSAPRVHAINAYQNRQLDMNAARLRRGATLIEKALADGEPRTREELQAALARGRLKLSGPSLAYAVMYAELEGLLCSGPPPGTEVYLHADRQARARDATDFTRDGLGQTRRTLLRDPRPGHGARLRELVRPHGARCARGRRRTRPQFRARNIGRPDAGFFE